MPDKVKVRFENSAISELRFTECEVGLALLIKQDHDLLSALSPRSYSYEGDMPCENLSEIIGGFEASEKMRLRPRYWWGVRAVYSIFLEKFTIEQISIIMQVSAYVGFVLLALALFRLGSTPFFISLPFITIAPFFSGISFYSEAPIALGFIWAVTASSMYAFLINSKYARYWLYPFLIFAGMTSAFFWFMGGELLLFVPLLLLITVLNSKSNVYQEGIVINTIKVGATFHIGFVTSMIIGYGLKAAVLGVEPIIASFSEAANHRLSSQVKGLEISSFDVIHELLYRGFQHTAVYDSILLWKGLILSAAIAFMVSTIYLIIRGIKKPSEYGTMLLVFMSILLYFFVRVLAVPNHSYIHSWMIGRYMVVPICLCWSMLIYSVCDYKKVGMYRGGK